MLGRPSPKRKFDDTLQTVMDVEEMEEDVDERERKHSFWMSEGRDITRSQNLALEWLKREAGRDPRCRLMSEVEFHTLSDFDKQFIKDLGYGVYIVGLFDQGACNIVLRDTVNRIINFDNDLPYSLAFKHTILEYFPKRNAAMRTGVNGARVGVDDEGRPKCNECSIC